MATWRSRSAAPRTSCSSTWPRRSGGRFAVFSLDTGRLHPETYQFLEKVRTHYELPIDTFFPQPEAVQKLVHEKGCSPSTRTATRNAAACARSSRWCGRSSRCRPGSPASARIRARARAPRCRWCSSIPTFGSPERPLVKFNPLANWTSKQVWAYIREHDVPYNALHERGFISIGCEPCTRADQPRRARARRPLVVGRGDHEGMRPPRRQREVSRATAALDSADVVGIDGARLLGRADGLAEALAHQLQHAGVDLLAALVAHDEERARARRRAALPSTMPGLLGSSSSAHTTSSIRSSRPRDWRCSVASAHFRQSEPSLQPLLHHGDVHARGVAPPAPWRQVTGRQRPMAGVRRPGHGVRAGASDEQGGR